MARIDRSFAFKNILEFVALCLLSLTCHAALVEEPPLRFVVTDTWAMPLLQTMEGEVAGGILFDFKQRLAESVGRRIQMVALPRRRIEELIHQHQIDALCYANPIWLPKTPGNFVWSTPFMVQQDLLVARSSERLTPEDIKGQVVGVVLGFVYPSLDPLFIDKQLTREDARTQEQVLLKLEAGRYRYAVSDRVSLDYFNARNPETEHLWPVFEVASYDVSCLIRDEEGVPVQALLNSIVNLKETRMIEKILGSYR